MCVYATEMAPSPGELSRCKRDRRGAGERRQRRKQKKKKDKQSRWPREEEGNRVVLRKGQTWVQYFRWIQVKKIRRGELRKAQRKIEKSLPRLYEKRISAQEKRFE